jgi:holin-like protein
LRARNLQRHLQRLQLARFVAAPSTTNVFSGTSPWRLLAWSLLTCGHAPNTITPPRRPGPGRFAAMNRIGRTILGIAALVAVHRMGLWITGTLHLPLPGNVVGMLLLLALLCFGVVPVRLVEQGAGLLTRHLAFFFVPIAVGLMNMGSVFLANGIALLCLLAASAGAGICITGSVSQALLAKTSHSANPSATVPAVRVLT